MTQEQSDMRTSKDSRGTEKSILDEVAHDCNSRTQEVKATLSLRPTEDA